MNVYKIEGLLESPLFVTKEALIEYADLKKLKDYTISTQDQPVVYRHGWEAFLREYSLMPQFTEEILESWYKAQQKKQAFLKTSKRMNYEP